MNIYYSLWLIIKLIWLIAWQNKAKWKVKLKGQRRRAESGGDASQLPEEQDVLEDR